MKFRGCPRKRCVVHAILVGITLSAMAMGHANTTWAEDKPPRQSAREADLAMKEIMANRVAVRGVTARGQSPKDAPAFKVVERKPALTKYPCSSCHDPSFVDTRVRVLKEEHSDLVFDHGGGKLWCYDACHNGRDMNTLVSARRRPVDYDRSYEVCGQCHFEQLKDWSFGGHGRRSGAWAAPRDTPLTHDKLRVVERGKIASWKGERTLLNCTACHNPHSPAIKPFALSPEPLVRSGLKREESEPEKHLHAWERETAETGKKP